MSFRPIAITPNTETVRYSPLNFVIVVMKRILVIPTTTSFNSIPHIGRNRSRSARNVFMHVYPFLLYVMFQDIYEGIM